MAVSSFIEVGLRTSSEAHFVDNFHNYRLADFQHDIDEEVKVVADDADCDALKIATQRLSIGDIEEASPVEAVASVHLENEEGIEGKLERVGLRTVPQMNLHLLHFAPLHVQKDAEVVGLRDETSG